MTKRKPIQPPGWAQKLLKWYCRPELLEDLEGDLNECFSRNCQRKGSFLARLIYIVDVIKFARSYTVKHPAAKSAGHSVLFRSYLISSARIFRRYPLSTALNVLGLGAALATFTGILLYVQFNLDYDRNEPRAERIYRIVLDITSLSNAESLKLACADAPLADNLRDYSSGIEAVTAIFKTQGKFRVANDRRVFMEQNLFHADSEYFNVFTCDWLEGGPAEALLNPNSIVVTASLRKKYFGNDQALNRTLTINDQLFVVTGVIADQPENTHLKFDGLMSGSPRDWAFTYVLLHSSADVDRLRPYLDTLVTENIGPGLARSGYVGAYAVEALAETHFGEDRFFDPPKGRKTVLTAFRGVALLILIIAVVNFINFTTAQVSKRQAAIGVRKIFGALQKHVYGQFVVESLLIFVPATLLSGILLIYVAPLVIVEFSPALLHASTDGVLFVIALALLPIVLCGGMYPVFFHFRAGGHQLLTRPAVPDRHLNVRRVLLLAQFSGSIGLLCAASVVSDQIELLLTHSPGFSKDHVVIIDVPSDSSVIARASAVREQFATLSFVKASSLAGESSTPAQSPYWDTYFIQPENSAPSVKMLSYVRVDENYFDALGVSFVQGRNFATGDYESKQSYVIVNEAMVASMGWREAVGKQISYGFGNEAAAKVIGVVKDFSFSGLHKAAEPMQFYLNYRAPEKFVISLSETSFKTLQALEDVWKKNFPSQPFDFHLLDDDFLAQLEQERSLRMMVILFSTVATLIAAVGLFGLVSLSVGQKMKENSIRAILGADITDILVLTWKEYIRLVAAAGLIAFPLVNLLMGGWLRLFAVRVDIGVGNLAAAMAWFGIALALALIHHVARLRNIKILDNIKSE